MSSILDIAVTGLNNATARIANAASNMVNASSTSPAVNTQDTDLASNTVTIAVAKNDFAANAAVIKTAQKLEKALLDITV